jgi:ABC-type lipoprotein export system ATPase subunit
MIKLEHIYKIYNKNKANEIVVCNDINITFPSSGLITILGASGSGKTTLLNVISGMDDFDKGTLIFDDVSISKYNHKKWDLIRKEKIGYVYQDYNLLKELTVYENIEPVLRMQGIDDKGTILEKVKYLLKSVGLDNYEDRLIKQLSGGQQQRVGFARALANNPEVMLADEPTGNLDGKTTIELMNIIKEISRTRLVILVTHEQVLCDYYADRIIEIESGKIIKDYINEEHKALDYLQEHIINLHDFNKTSLENEQFNISRYTNKKGSEKLDIDLIERNQTLYIKVNSKTLKRTKYLDDNSEIIIRDNGKFDEQSQNDFNLINLFPEEKTLLKTKAFNWKEIFEYALNKLKKLNISGKMLYLAMFMLGLIISVSIGLLGEIYHVEKTYNKLHENYITVEMDRDQYESYSELENVSGVDQLMLVTKPINFSVSPPDYYQSSGAIDVSAQPIDIKFFDENTLIYGELPSGYEIVIDHSVADKMIDDYASIGIKTYEDVLKCEFKIRTSGLGTSKSIESSLRFKISGIAKTKSLSVWMKEELIYSFVTPVLVDYRIMGDNFKIISGVMPTAPLYLLINDQYPSILEGNTPNNIGIATGHYEISGIYQYEVDGRSYNFEKVFVSSMEFMKKKYFRFSNYRHQDFELLVYATDVEQTLLSLSEAGYEAKANLYDSDIAQDLKLEENQTFYILALSGIVISALCIFLIMRSNLISRMYEVSVYRSIGVSRKEIKRIFLIEILLASTLSSVFGFLLMTFLLIQGQTTVLSTVIARFNLLTIVIVVIGIYLVNTVFGLLPINLLLRKTPSNIMKQNDL